MLKHRMRFIIWQFLGEVLERRKADKKKTPIDRKCAALRDRLGARIAIRLRPFKTLFEKSRAFRQAADKVETLAIGSSHGLYGFIAEDQEFNLCEASQDLYYSYRLYAENASYLKSLKRIVLFYSIFSPGFELEKTSEATRAVSYKIFYGIPFKFPETVRKHKMKRNESFAGMAAEMFKDAPYEKNFGNADFENQCPMPASTEERVASHMKNNDRGNNQTAYVSELARIAGEKSVDLWIVTPPLRKDYKALLPPSDVLFKDLYAALPALKAKLIHMHDAEGFDDADFADMDHLNRQGAEKLTAEIKKKGQN